MEYSRFVKSYMEKWTIPVLVIMTQSKNVSSLVLEAALSFAKHILTSQDKTKQMVTIIPLYTALDTFVSYYLVIKHQILLEIVGSFTPKDSAGHMAMVFMHKSALMSTN